MADEIQRVLLERKVKGELQKLGGNAPEKAIENLVKIGSDAIPYLLATFKDKDIKVKKYAALAIGKIKDKKAVDGLIKAILDENSEEVRESIGRAISNIGIFALKALLQVLEDEDMDEERKKRIIPAFDDSMVANLTKNSQAVYYFVKGNFAECAALGAVATPCLIKALARDDPEMVSKAETTLIRIGSGAVSDLIENLPTQNEVLRTKVLNILDKLDVKLFHSTEKASYYLAKGDIDKCLESKTTAIPALIKGLEDPREEVANNAIEGLRRMGTVVVDDLIKELKGRKRKTKGTIAKLLGEIRDKRAVEVLVSCLSDIESEVRITAAQSLCDIGDLRAVPFLINKALVDKEKKVREFTAIRLKNMGKAIAPQLIKILEDDKSSDEIKDIAMIVLGDIKADAAVRVVSNFMLKGVGKTRELAAKVLGEIGSPMAVDNLIGVIDDAKELSGWQRGHNATVALGKIGDKRAVPVLIKVLHDERFLSQMQASAAEALGKIGDKSVIEDLIKALDNRKIHGDVIKAMGKLGDQRGAEPLRKMLIAEDSSMPLREIVIEALGNIGNKSVTDDIIKALEKEKLQIQGVIALGKLGATEAVPKISELLYARRSNEKLKKACIDSLITMKDEEAVLSLVRAMKIDSINPEVRSYIMENFVKTGEVLVSPFIYELNNDENKLFLKEKLVKLLGDLKSPKSVPDLLILAGNTNDASMKTSIILALASIKDDTAVTFLNNELENKANNILVRKASLGAIINIESKKSLPVIQEIFSDESDPLRNYTMDIFKKLKIRTIDEAKIR